VPGNGGLGMEESALGLERDTIPNELESVYRHNYLDGGTTSTQSTPACGVSIIPSIAREIAAVNQFPRQAHFALPAPRGRGGVGRCGEGEAAY